MDPYLDQGTPNWISIRDLIDWLLIRPWSIGYQNEPSIRALLACVYTKASSLWLTIWFGWSLTISSSTDTSSSHPTNASRRRAAGVSSLVSTAQRFTCNMPIVFLGQVVYVTFSFCSIIFSLFCYIQVRCHCWIEFVWAFNDAIIFVWAFVAVELKIDDLFGDCWTNLDLDWIWCGVEDRVEWRSTPTQIE